MSGKMSDHDIEEDTLDPKAGAIKKTTSDTSGQAVGGSLPAKDEERTKPEKGDSDEDGGKKRRSSMFTLFNTMDLKERRRTLEGLLDLCQDPERTSSPVRQRHEKAEYTSTPVHHHHEEWDKPVEVREVIMSKKLPRFSGKTPVSGGEVSFKAWYEAAQRLLKEKFTEHYKKDRIFDSLSGEAYEVAQGSEDLKEVVENLKQWFGSTMDGEDHLFTFHHLNQNDKEAPSAYYQRLYLQLGKAVRTGSVQHHQIPELLLKHFIRSCEDEQVLDKLKLEELQDHPPSVMDTLMKMRKIEGRRTEKKLRYRVHQKATRSTTPPDSEEEDKQLQGSAENKSLKTQVSQLQQQLNQMKRQSRGSHVQKSEAASSEKSSNDVKEMLFQVQKDMGLMKERFEQKQSNVAQTHYQGTPPQNSGRSTGRQPLKFCFKCGKDGHHLLNCRLPADPDRVAARFRQAREDRKEASEN